MTPYTHSRSFGNGPRKALAIHCTLAHSGAWRGVASALADDLTITAMDMAGHGKSGEWDGNGDLHDAVTEMALSLIDEPVDLIGHSFGATVALRLAVERPDLVRTATLVEPVLFAALLPDFPDLAAECDRLFQPVIHAYEAGDLLEAARSFNRDWGDGTRWDNIPEPTRDYMVKRIGFVHASNPFIREDNQGLLKPGVLERATMPGVLIEGATSPKSIDAINGTLHKRLPHFDRVAIEGAGHMAPITHPKHVAAAIKELIDRT